MKIRQAKKIQRHVMTWIHLSMIGVKGYELRVRQDTDERSIRRMEKYVGRMACSPTPN